MRKCLVCGKENISISNITRTNLLGHSRAKREGYAFWHSTGCQEESEGRINWVEPDLHEQVEWSKE